MPDSRTQGGDSQSMHAVPSYLRHYRRIIDTEGAGFDATGWRNETFQIERFNVLTQMQDLNGRIVLDAGAGRADLAAFLLKREVRYRRFIALEAMPEMSELIEERRLPDVSVVTADFVSESDAFARCGAVDVIFFSGSLNTLEQPAALAALERAWAACRESVVFNFLTSRCPPELAEKNTGPAHRFDPLALLDWALSRTPLVQFRQEYLGGHDATIAMFKPDERSGD